MVAPAAAIEADGVALMVTIAGVEVPGVRQPKFELTTTEYEPDVAAL